MSTTTIIPTSPGCPVNALPEGSDEIPHRPHVTTPAPSLMHLWRPYQYGASRVSLRPVVPDSRTRA